jgi:ABC-2 type transport system permease protein
MTANTRNDPHLAPPQPPGTWRRQLGSLIAKEFRQIVRDPSSYLVAGVLPVLFLMLFGHGITLDTGRLPLAVVDQSQGSRSISLTSDFAWSPWFSTTPAVSLDVAGRRMSDSQVQGILVIRDGFDRSIAAGDAGKVQILVDGAEPNMAKFIQGYTEAVLGTWQTEQLPPQLTQPAIRLEDRLWYNPTAKSIQFLVPGAVTVIMTLIGTLLTSLVIAREWERGTMEGILATPVTRMQILLGKLVPYFFMGMLGMAICAVTAVVCFDIPLRGSLKALILLSSVFMLSSLGQGLLISVSLRGQLVAAQAGLFTGFLPALLLSGFVFDIESMPLALRLLTHLVPARYFNTCLRTCFLTGDVWEIYVPSLCYMGLLAAILLGSVYAKLQKRL